MKRSHILLDSANLWIWLATSIIVAILGNLATKLVQDSIPRFAFFSVLVIFIFLGMAFSDTVRKMVRERQHFAQIDFQIHVPPARALIVFVSKGPGSSSALDAAFHHAKGDHLQDLWMIASEESISEAKRIEEQITSQHPRVKVHPVTCIHDINSIREAKSEVENLRGKCLRKYHESEVICDFTGLTKNMSAGMIFACAHREARLQYMHPNSYLPDGRADVNAGSHAVEVKIAYQIEEEE
ncbi:MAG TPA: hypothetical protein VFK06_14820 [Candidatus Angelobacter sp.]|nr:hypothetical protein [Candidatus Angelobacter sp.]